MDRNDIKTINDYEFKFVIDGFKKTAKETDKKDKIVKTIFLVLTYLILIFFAFIMMIPFYWMLISSLKGEIVNGNYVGLDNKFFISFYALYINFIPHKISSVHRKHSFFHIPRRYSDRIHPGSFRTRGSEYFRSAPNLKAVFSHGCFPTP